jgi:hypothetical protein
MTDIAVFLVGVGIGLLVTIAILWRRRDEVARAWQQRGENTSAKLPSHTRLTIAIHVLAALGSAYLAIEASDGAVRAVSLFVCVVAVASIGVLLLQSRRSQRST